MSTNDPDSGPQRWPRRVYEAGEEPDARFTLANERTFLAWLRTSLALMAAGVGVEALNVEERTGRSPLWTTLAFLLLAGGVLCSATAFTRWMSTERALRTSSPLPAPRLLPVLGYGLALIGAAACVLLLVIAS